jgi:hypothetical protein
LRLNVGAQSPLEIGIGVKAQPRDEAQNRRGAGAGEGRELGNGGQPDTRIIGEKGVSDLLFRRGKVAQHGLNLFANGHGFFPAFRFERPLLHPGEKANAGSARGLSRLLAANQEDRSDM